MEKQKTKNISVEENSESSHAAANDDPVLHNINKPK